MKIKNILLFSFILMFALGSCMKKDNFDPQEQAAKDEATIVKFLADNNIVAVRHESGLYYKIIEPGSGDKIYNANTSVTAKYTGRFLNGTAFDNPDVPATFPLGGVIVGWQIGVPIIQKGGKIRLLIPSQYAYGRDGDVSGVIPPNTVLDFDIELVDVQN